MLSILGLLRRSERIKVPTRNEFHQSVRKPLQGTNFELSCGETIIKVQMFYLLSFSATANRSASGSLARITDDPFWLAVMNERSRALFPSSGFGNRTVGNSGSGSICSFTGINGYIKKKIILTARKQGRYALISPETSPFCIGLCQPFYINKNKRLR